MASWLQLNDATAEDGDSLVDLRHSYSDLETIDNEIELHEVQLRIFQSEDAFPAVMTELVLGEDFTIDVSDPLNQWIVLAEPLVPDTVTIVIRQTRRDRLYVNFTDISRFFGVDADLYSQQILFLCEEIREEGEIAAYISGEIDLFEPVPTDVIYPNASLFTITQTDSTNDEIFYEGEDADPEIELLANDRYPHQLQLLVTLNGNLLVADGDYQVLPGDFESSIILFVPPTFLDTVEIRRSSATYRLVSSPNATAFSSGTVELNFTHLRLLIEELPFWVGLEDHPLKNYRNPGQIQYLIYSGPGDAFPWFGIPWNPDSTLLVYLDGVLLVEGEDYTLDSWGWQLFFPLLEGQTLTILLQSPQGQFPNQLLALLQQQASSVVTDPPTPPEPEPEPGEEAEITFNLGNPTKVSTKGAAPTQWVQILGQGIFYNGNLAPGGGAANNNNRHWCIDSITDGVWNTANLPGATIAEATLFFNITNVVLGGVTMDLGFIFDGGDVLPASQLSAPGTHWDSVRAQFEGNPLSVPYSAWAVGVNEVDVTAAIQQCVSEGSFAPKFLGLVPFVAQAGMVNDYAKHDNASISTLSPTLYIRYTPA